MFRIVYNTYIEDAARWTALSIFLVTFFISSIFSFFSGVFILICYIAGYVACWLFLKNQGKVFTFLNQFNTLCVEDTLSDYGNQPTCVICKSNACKRHSSRLNPLRNLYLSKELNTTIEKFFEKILETYLVPSYNSFTSDTSFLDELKVCLRYSTATFLSKLLDVDASKVLTTRLVPCVIKHVDDYISIKQIAKIRNAKVNDIAVDYFGKKLHLAATNRENELNYLRNLTSCLLPYFLHGDCLKCRNFFVIIREIIAMWVLLPLMDLLANPNMINLLVIFTCTHKVKWLKIQSQPTEKVEYLCNFKRRYPPKSSFMCNLKKIFTSTELLYVFMQFLKKEGSVHMLQFCLDIEEFNCKLLNPDLTKKQIESIHKDALNLYKIYFDPNSADCIGCSHKIVTSFKELIEKGIYSIVKLRTSEPLYQAYDYAYSYLENEWLPLFYHSNEFYNYICGSKLTPTFTKAIVERSQRNYETVTSKVPSKFSSSMGRIRTALRPNQPIEGALYPQEHQIIGEKTASYVEDVILSEHAASFRDLSAWRVLISSVDVQQFSNSKQIYFYNINVQRIDTVSENEIQHWVVRRKDEDFYNLKSKLVEFHGESEICNSPLPSRRFSVPLETRKLKYEEFLKSLLQKPNLRGSDLLYTFLTTEQDFTLFLNTTSSFAFVDDIGNIYQTFAFKIRKEKGQRLDNFMNVFISSTGYSKSKFEWAEVGDEFHGSCMDNSQNYPLPKSVNSSLFKNNFNLHDRILKESSCTSSNANGITESLFYLLKHIFKVPQSILKLYVAVCIVSQPTIEIIFNSLVDYKLKNLLSEHNLISLIRIIQGVIFEHHTPPTEEELKSRKAKAFDELEKSIPKILPLILGRNFIPGLKDLLDVLQNPLCNKQLAYNLLDIIIAEVFPNLDSNN